MEPVKLALLGASGSIGESTLAVVRANPGKFKVEAVTGNTNLSALQKIVEEFSPRHVCVADSNGVAALRRVLPSDVHVHGGDDSIVMAASLPEVEIVVGAVVGFAGLRSTLAAIDSGKRLALANKESLVAGGELVMSRLRKSRARMLSIDSEHASIHQCLVGYKSGVGIRKIAITASGGPFLHTDVSLLDHVTPAEAVRHPRWQMGAKISVDSATMMNKGLEVIEAHYLFGLPLQDIEVLVHPQSIVHGLVEFNDRSVIAALYEANMQSPIAFVLEDFYRELRCPGCHDGFGEREQRERNFATTNSSLDLIKKGRLEFMPVDAGKFPALDLCRKSLQRGGSAAAVLNAANEEAVSMFLGGEIRFTEIVQIVEAVTSSHQIVPLETYEQIVAVDRWAREAARKI
ncbi:MAG: 1-deoxy-D-xylulose-5-phosphate reductoisomerase [bacterium]|nr:1-deoxy-D-xylulose-5-phosphate reductoisomerase [bacterium]